MVGSVYICMGNPRGVKRDFQALEKRRFEAIRLLDQGHNQSETARRLKVARQTVSEWLRQYRQHGPAGLRRAGRAGRKPLLDAAQLERLAALLLEGPEAHGFPTPLWTCPRVARLITDEFGVNNFYLLLARNIGSSKEAFYSFQIKAESLHGLKAKAFHRVVCKYVGGFEAKN